MSDLVEHSDKGNGERTVEAVRVGDGHSTVSLKTYQDIYHQVTGRTEQIRKRYSENLLIELGEIEQLNYKIRQLCDVHQVVAANDTVTVFHEKERKEQFTSFERFRAYNTNSASPTVSLVLRYNFSITPAGNSRPQEYVVNVRLVSKVAALRQIQDEAPPFIQGRLFGFMAGPAVEVTVDYADYVIARGFLEAADEWVKGCKTTPPSAALRLLQRHSHHIPELGQVGAAVMVSYFAYQAVPGIVADGGTAATWANFAIIFIGGSYVAIRLGRKFAELIEIAIDTFPELSYIKLNRGDEKIIESARNSKPLAWLRLIGGIVGSIAVSILSSKLEKLI
jgi:hypothetical protein